MRYAETSGKTYRENLQEVHLTSLEDRRVRGDMLQVWKYLHGLQDVDVASLFTLKADATTHTGPAASTRGSTKGLAVKEREFNTDIRRYSFTVRVVTAWNNLPEQVRLADSVDTFKIEYDKYMLGN